MTSNSVDDLLTSGDEQFAVIERLADAIRTENDVRISDEDRERLVQELYEGPKKCACCINWINEIPPDIELDTVEAPESPYPIIVRKRVSPTEVEGKTRVTIHSLEVCNPEVRKVLFDVFDGYDNLEPEVKYLVFKAPFRPFFWRWARFEKAIEDEQNEVVKAVLLQIRSVVKADLAEAFAVSKELVPHGIITWKQLWTIFPPGEVVYDADYRHSGTGCFYTVTSSGFAAHNPHYYEIVSCAVDHDGYRFGYRTHYLGVDFFRGTRRINELLTIPEKFVRDGDAIRQKCIERGKRFQELVGKKYMAYLPDKRDMKQPGVDPTKNMERRIILDMAGHPRRRNSALGFLGRVDGLDQFTTLITQAPVDSVPAGGHRPLRTEEDSKKKQRKGARYDSDDYSDSDYEVRPARRSAVQPQYYQPRPVVLPRRRRSSSASSVDSTASLDRPEYKTDANGKRYRVLTDLQYQMCDSTMYGYDLRDKRWGIFDVDRIKDIEFNTEPFDSLVLPPGYKDLVLSFVENQLKDGDTFDDVINGKGGGLVILLAGEPGVGKTLTAESVAEKIKAPLVKMELSQLTKAVVDRHPPPHMGHQSRTATAIRHQDPLDGQDELTTTFDQAARWGAVLLIDECDAYLEKRNDNSPDRNHVVSQFLRELEYYPSLLFLTTNREKALDPAVYSRIHLTLNFSHLDKASRKAIWSTFLGREKDAVITDEEYDKLAEIDINGRKIKNITKTARILAKRSGRGINLNDIQTVMRITEGLDV
ncbi:P-loop containing nucleoside triphosphate hydrolase protein [Podospora aff. communis PSN243]|uniref:P-loop containing nucleoside triphosphate hydrolase protein n=1 Tax=Podospora aff. communis PSN243 TaxID=3040156 RepID=A0AAV9GP05_9PEZI|nr:P-loop containing nucleoside triphosphate hydrolase protein [Podospora aff. communis PSN243]